MKWEQLVELGKELPEVVLDKWFGTPALKVVGKAFCRLKEDGKDVVFMVESVDEQLALCDSTPDIYYITDHYRGYPALLARLAKLTVKEARVRLERGWTVKAPQRLVAAATADAAPAAARRRSTKADAAPAEARRRSTKADAAPTKLRREASNADAPRAKPRGKPSPKRSGPEKRRSR